MGPGVHKNTLFINYLPRRDKVQLGSETLVKAVIFFFFFFLCVSQKRNFLLRPDESKERHGGNRAGE